MSAERLLSVKLRRSTSSSRRSPGAGDGRPSPIVRPIFVLGAWRSGTTMIFQALSAHPDLWTLYRESQPVLDPSFPVRMVPGDSEVVTAAQVDERTASELRWRFFEAVGNMEAAHGRAAKAVPLIARVRLSPLTTRLGIRVKRPPVRMVEKTPANCLRVGMLRAVFPDAQFIFVVRDPRGSIASLHHGWTSEPRFRTYRLPPDFRIEGYSGHHWCFGLIPGWERLNGATLTEVCATQWMIANEYALADLPADSRSVLTIRYEDVVARPGDVLSTIATWADLDPEPLRRFNEGLPVVNTWSRPRPDKWRRLEGELAKVEPLIAPTSQRLGYGGV